MSILCPATCPSGRKNEVGSDAETQLPRRCLGMFKTHQCNKACELLGLHANPIPVRADSGIDHARTAPATHPRGHLPGHSQHAV
eukprot:2614695-Rhodomonas_salina.1